MRLWRVYIRSLWNGLNKIIVLKEVIEKDFFLSYPKRDSNELVNVEERMYVGTFSLSNEDSCCRCLHTANCNNENLIVNSDMPIYVLRAQSFLKYLHQSDFGKNADLLMCGDDAFRLVEMTCSKNEYVANCGYKIGKRDEAYNQCENLLLLLYGCYPVAEFIKSHSIKEAIFSWRKTDEFDDEDGNMFHMLKLQEHIDRIYTRNMSNGFTFRIHLYPELLIW